MIPSIVKSLQRPQGRFTYRRHAAYKVFAANMKNMDWIDVTYLVSSVSVTESESDHDTVNLELISSKFQLHSDELLRERFSILVFMGYRDIGLHFFGQFILDTPRPSFPSSGFPTISMSGKDVSMEAGEGEGIATYPGMTHSGLAQSIAEKYGWETDIEETDRSYYLARSGESELSLLKSRAALDGYTVFMTVENRNGKITPVLHYHSPRTLNEDYIPELWYSNSQNPLKINLMNFDIDEATYKRGMDLQSGGIEYLTGQQSHVNTSVLSEQKKRNRIDVELDAVRRMKHTKDDEYQRTQREQEFAVVQGVAHSYEGSELMSGIQRVKQAEQFFITGKGKTLYGHPLIRKYRKTRIRGVNKFSGLYVITSTTHSISESGYETEFTAKATGTRQPDLLSDQYYGRTMRRIPSPIEIASYD